MKLRSQQIRRRAGLLSELAELLIEEMEELGIPTEQAEDAAGNVAFQLHRRWAGIVFTFPMRDDLARERMEKYIVERYDGRNAVELVREFRITERSIYSIIKKHRRQG